MERSAKSEQYSYFRSIPFLFDYPKNFSLKDGRKVMVRPMLPSDVDELYAFFANLDREDKLFLRDDVSDISVIKRWAENLNYDIVLPLLAFYDGKVVADGTLHASNFLWTRHVAEIRIAVSKDFRGVGLAKKIISELFFIAIKRGFKKVIAQIPFHQQNVIHIFDSLGFEKEAILRKHIMIQGKGFSDLLIMSAFVGNAIQQLKRVS